MQPDERGLGLSTDSADAAALFDRSVEHYLKFHADTPMLVGQMLAADPHFALGHCFKGYLLLSASNPAFRSEIAATLAAAQTGADKASDRERRHIAAFAAWAGGGLDRSFGIWRELLDEYPTDLLAAERKDVDAVTREWLGGAVDRGFSMAMDDLHSHPQARFALATDASGRVRGYLHLVPSGRGYSLSAMRRGRDTPNGLMEYVIVRTALWAAPEGVEELSLNFSAFADVLRADRAAPMRLRLTRAVLLRLDRFFQLERLFSFNRKFHPTWRTRYICFERAIDVPVLSLATLHAERLIGPPGRFAARRR